MKTDSRGAARLGLFLVFGLVLSAGNCFDPDEHSPTSMSFQDALRVTLSAESIPADATSTLIVTAEIDPRAEAANRTLVFETSAGRFLEATADPFRTVERAIDSAGRASVTLRSSRDVGPVGLTVKVKDKESVLVRTTVQFTRATPSGTIAFVGLPATAPADDTTLTRLVVGVDESLPSGQRTVTFTTNRGTFASTGTGTASATAGADHRARIDLKSPLAPGTANLTATVDGVTVDAALEFVPALPDTILVNPGKLVLQATSGEGGTTPVAVRLLRDEGKASPATPQPRLVEEDSGAEIPALFRGLEPTDSDGRVTITLTVGSVAYRGPALIEIRVEGSPAVGRARVEIVDPPPA